MKQNSNTLTTFLNETKSRYTHNIPKVKIFTHQGLLGSCEETIFLHFAGSKTLYSKEDTERGLLLGKNVKSFSSNVMPKV